MTEDFRQRDHGDNDQDGAGERDNVIGKHESLFRLRGALRARRLCLRRW